MSVLRAHLVWPDVKAWAIGYLTTALAARPEPVATGVHVSGSVPEAMPPRLVTVRDDGGPRGDVTQTARLGVNVWAATEADCSGLSRLVASILGASAGSGQVVACEITTGPYEIPEESGIPHRYLTADVVVTGTSLT